MFEVVHGADGSRDDIAVAKDRQVEIVERFEKAEGVGGIDYAVPVVRPSHFPIPSQGGRESGASRQHSHMIDQRGYTADRRQVPAGRSHIAGRHFAGRILAVKFQAIDLSRAGLAVERAGYSEYATTHGRAIRSPCSVRAIVYFLRGVQQRRFQNQRIAG